MTLPWNLKEPRPERNGATSRAVQNDPVYAAMIENLDTNVGRILDRLDELQLSNNTLVIFTSDNGGLSTGRRPGPTSCLPLRGGKGWTYEGGIRIPNIVAWPSRIKPGVCNTPAITMDLYPTILELTGQPLRPHQHIDGHSLKSAIAGSPDDELQTRFLAWTYPHNHGSLHSPSNAIRSGNWKLIQCTNKEPNAEQSYELYDLANDVGETQNLADKHPEITARLTAELNRWLTTTKASEQLGSRLRVEFIMHGCDSVLRNWSRLV